MNNENNKSFAEFYNSKSKFWVKIKQNFIKNFLEEVKFCPYCWKVPLITFDEYNGNEDSKQKRTFQLDHFFPKSNFPSLWCNLYNIVPSCYSCNFLKIDKNPEDWIFHPYFWTIVTKNWNKYFDGQDLDINFIDGENLSSKRNQKHIEFFKLKSIYSYSQDTHNDIKFIRDKVEKMKSDNRREIDINDDVIDYFFKNFYPKDGEKILLYSNWKLKRDFIDYIKKYLKIKN